MAIFAAVIDQGSFRAAASHLGLSSSWVSEAVSELEREIGVTLLYRSTRSLSPTPEGALLYEQASIMLSAAEKGLDAVIPQSNDPVGLLRASLPAFVAQTPMMDTIGAFSATYPNVTLNLDFSDHQRDLIGEGFDVGVRIGVLKDSELLSRNLGYVNRLLVVSKKYAVHRSTPKHPSDLESWDWVRFSARNDQFKLTKADGQTVRIKGRSKTTVNSADATHQLVLRGFGISPLPENIARTGIETGDLLHLLPDWALEPLGLYAVWPARSDRQNLARLLVNFLADGTENRRGVKDRVFPPHPSEKPI
ncbi:MAG: LysR family transcriptional regulator [Pseudomonadota bacterium]